MSFRLAILWLVVGGLASLSNAQKNMNRFPVEAVDFLGYCGWDIQGPLPHQTSTASTLLRTGRYAEADRLFLKSWQANHLDFAALHGLVLCAQKGGRLGWLIDIFHREQSARRKKGGDFSPPLLFAIFYTDQIASYFYLREGDKRAYIPENALGRMYADSAPSHLSPTTFRDRRYAAMYASALYAMGRLGETRRLAKAYLELDPQFYQLRLVLARTYTGGVVSSSIGGKKELVPEDEKADPAEGLRLAKEVILQAPTYALGYYEAGMNCTGSDPSASVGYLRKFLQFEGQSASRRGAAQQVIDQIQAGEKRSRTKG